MTVSDLLFLVLFAFGPCIFASPLAAQPAPDYIFDGDAPFSVNSTFLANALTCPYGKPTEQWPPVLLVHGTGTTGEESWAQGYVPALRANRYIACFVTLPGRAMGDMQISSEYIAYAIHHLSFLADGLPTAIITHSQGGPDTQWALQFWPSTRRKARAFVALSPDFSGIELLHSSLSKICVGDLCQASVRQQSVGSNYYAALHGDNFTALVPTTAVWSQFDEVVVPARENAQLPGAMSVAVQDVCPGRVIDHIFMPIDSAGFALAVDAISHDGHADVARVKKDQHRVCYRITAKNMRVDLATQLESLWDDLVNGWVYMLSLNVNTVRYLTDGKLGAPRVSSEPPLMPYAQ